jgi:1-acyl-sn-glycerol-3-phosphate acyltransferase
MLFAVQRIAKPRDTDRALANRALWLHGVCRRALRVLGVRVFIQGKPTLGALLTPNHLSYLDIIVLAAQLPVVFVAKQEVRSWPVFGWFAARAGTRFIDRQRRNDVARTSDELSPCVRAGVNAVIFLEGTSSDGRAVLSFKSSLLASAIEARWNVQPVALIYAAPREHSAACEICWWGDMTLPGHLWNLLGLSQIHAHMSWGSPRAPGDDRKILAAQLHANVTELHAVLVRTVT